MPHFSMSDPVLVLLFLLSAVVLLLLAFLVWNHGKRDEQARNLFEEWKETHLEDTRSNLREEERLKSERWRSETEQRIRDDARTRSDHTHYGKITEHLVPWLRDTNFDPRDMRFIGSPVDFIVFEGLSEGRDVTVTFVEVKTGNRPKLTTREARVKEAILARRVDYRLLKIEKPPGTKG